MRVYAAKTRVPVSRSEDEIKNLLRAAKADQIGFITGGDQAAVMFKLGNRTIRFKLQVPANESRARERWRALVLCIKAKLESVRSGIEQFDEAFMSHIVMPDGQTMAEHALPAIDSAYSSGKMPQLTFGG